MWRMTQWSSSSPGVVMSTMSPTCWCLTITVLCMKCCNMNASNSWPYRVPLRCFCFGTCGCCSWLIAWTADRVHQPILVRIKRISWFSFTAYDFVHFLNPSPLSSITSICLARFYSSGISYHSFKFLFFACDCLRLLYPTWIIHNGFKLKLQGLRGQVLSYDCSVNDRLYAWST
jgi:hypothetical protein